MTRDGLTGDFLLTVDCQGARNRWNGTSFVDAGVPMAQAITLQVKLVCGFPRVAQLVAMHVIPTPNSLGTRIFVAAE